MVDLAQLVRLAESLGAEFADARYQRRVRETVVLDNGVIREASVSASRGVGLRVLVGGSVGYASTNSLTQEGLRALAERAVKAARAGARLARPAGLAAGPAGRGRAEAQAAVDPLSVDTSEKVALLRDIYSEVRGVGGVSSAVIRYAFEVDEREVATSWGAEARLSVRLVGVGGLVVASVGGKMERLSVGESRAGGWEFVKSFDWLSYFRESAELAVGSAAAPSIEPGRYDVVLDGEMVGLLVHEAFGHASEGDAVASGRSVLRGRLGEAVASELVTIADSGIAEGGYPVPFDDEGTPKGRTPIVERGVLVGYLHSLETAHEMAAAPTGNARAMGYGDPVLVRMTNTYMEPGDWRPDEIIQDTKRGVYVRGRGAMGGEVDPSTGSFTFTGGPSNLIEGGELRGMVRGVMLAGNILEALKGVDAVGRDLVVKTSVFGGCGKGGQVVRVGTGGPHVRVRGMSVGG